MGNRAVITPSMQPKAPSIYLHWNGGRCSVEAFLEAARRLGLRHLQADPTADMDRLAELIARHFFNGQVGFTVYRQVLRLADTSNCDNGTFVIDRGLRIIHRYGAGWRNEEVDPEKTAAIVERIVQRAPIFTYGPEVAP